MPGRILSLLTMSMAAGLLLSVCARADTIIFKHGTRLECQVVETSEEGVVVIVGDNPDNRIVLNPATIDKIEYDFESRFKRLGAEDYRGHYELGLWCEEMVSADEEMALKALERFQYVLGKPDIPDEVYLHLGRMYEYIKPPNEEQALSAYKMYIQAHPESTEAIEAVARLQEIVEAREPTVEKSAAEGLETKQWLHEGWSNPAKVRKLTDVKNNNNVVLELAYEDNTKYKAAFKLLMKDNLSAYGRLVFDVYNDSEQTVPIAVAMVAGQDSLWYELTAPAGCKRKAWTQNVEIDLQKKNWKSFKMDKQLSNATAPDLKRVYSLLILVFNREKKGKVYIDSIRFEE